LAIFRAAPLLLLIHLVFPTQQLWKLGEVNCNPPAIVTLIKTNMMLAYHDQKGGFACCVIVEFKRAKLMQDARLSGVTVKDIARALASMIGVKAVSEFDAGITASYLRRAEELLELAIEFARERRGDNS
jgi:hypothetical protein